MGRTEKAPQAEHQAKDRAERLEERIRFLTHATYFVGLSVLFAFLDYLSSGRLSWSPYIVGVWGVFLYVHFLRAFVVADLQGPFRRWLLRRECDQSGPEDQGRC